MSISYRVKKKTSKNKNGTKVMLTQTRPKDLQLLYDRRQSEETSKRKCSRELKKEQEKKLQHLKITSEMGSDFTTLAPPPPLHTLVEVETWTDKA